MDKRRSTFVLMPLAFSAVWSAPQASAQIRLLAAPAETSAGLASAGFASAASPLLAPSASLYSAGTAPALAPALCAAAAAPSAPAVFVPLDAAVQAPAAALVPPAFNPVRASAAATDGRATAGGPSAGLGAAGRAFDGSGARESLDGVERALAPHLDGSNNLQTKALVRAYLKSGAYSTMSSEIARMVDVESSRRPPLVRLFKTRRQRELLAVKDRLDRVPDSPAVKESRRRDEELALALASAPDEAGASRLLDRHFAWVHSKVQSGEFTPYYARLVLSNIYSRLPPDYPRLVQAAMSAVARYPVDR